MKTFDIMWHDRGMVRHIMPKTTHEFIGDDRYPFPELSNYLYFA
jgi:hypothetical protein